MNWRLSNLIGPFKGLGALVDIPFNSRPHVLSVNLSVARTFTNSFRSTYCRDIMQVLATMACCTELVRI